MIVFRGEISERAKKKYSLLFAAYTAALSAVASAVYLTIAIILEKRILILFAIPCLLLILFSYLQKGNTL